MQVRLATQIRDFSRFACICRDDIDYHSSIYQTSSLCCDSHRRNADKLRRLAEKSDKYASYGFQPDGKMGNHNRNPCVCPINDVACNCPPSDEPENDDVFDPYLVSDPSVKW